MIELYHYGYGHKFYPSSFKEFVNNIYNNKYTEYNRHRYRTMLDWITDDNNVIRIDYIIRFENLEKEFYELLDKLNIPKLVLPKLKTAKQRTGKERKHYREYYDDETRELIYKIYKEDLEYFNYSF